MRAVVELGEEVVGQSLDDFEFEFGVGALEGEEDLREQVGSDGADDAQAQGSLEWATRGGGGHLVEPADLSEDRLGLVEQGVAGAGRAGARGVALEEFDAELLLEFADPLAERGLRDVARLGGVAHRAALADGDGVFELADIHGTTPVDGLVLAAPI